MTNNKVICTIVILSYYSNIIILVYNVRALNKKYVRNKNSFDSHDINFVNYFQTNIFRQKSCATNIGANERPSIEKWWY